MNPIFVAIDTADVHHARALVRDLDRRAGGVKLGLEFFCANGEEGVLRVAEHEVPLFLDLKFHDIPNTVAGAVRSIAHLTPAVLTVHAAGGKDMMKAAKDAAPPGTKVVAVTVLTSLDADDLEAIGVRASPARQVERLAALAREAGLDGIVCSGDEVKAAKADWPDGYDPAQPGEAVAVIKGGSFLCAPNYCARYRPEARQGQSRGLGTSHIGFRTVFNP